LSDRRLIIAIDGPAGAGKSTVAKHLARRLNYLLINSGAMYRAFAWKIINLKIPLDDLPRIGRLAGESFIDLQGEVDATRVLIDGQDITDQISSPQVSYVASIVSTIPAVRRALVARQQEMGKTGGAVIEGRDIGTHVFPDAQVKIYLDASPEKRSWRRFTEAECRGTIEEMREEIEARDFRDKTRSDSPLEQAENAIYIDSSELTIDQVVERILAIVYVHRDYRRNRENSPDLDRA
jgi:cytidylate kinase